MALRPIYHVGIIAVTLALAACSSAAPPRGERPGSPTVGAQVGHIHAVDLNPTDGSVFAATHHGVFRIDPRGGPVQVIGRGQDMRGFTVTDDDRILAGIPTVLRPARPISASSSATTARGPGRRCR